MKKDPQIYLGHIEYFQVDLSVVWDTVKQGIPELKEQISGLLEN